MNVLEVRGLSKRYAGSSTVAVSDVSLTVRSGEVLAVVGESGSGKTTLLRLIAGLEVPTAGEVLLNGHVASSPAGCVPPERRGVGIVFQEYALFPHLTVYDNVAFGLQSQPRVLRRNRTGEVLAMVGLADYGRRFPHELSGGQQQRVALARALAPGPSLLLLDEPFSNLDLLLKEQVRDDVAAILRAAGTTALFVVHDLDDVLSVATRIAILKAGELQQIDTPQAVYERPADAYVARLFGTTNLFRGVPRPAPDNGEAGFETALGFIASPRAREVHGPVLLSLGPQDLQLTPEPAGAPGPSGAPPAPTGASARVRGARFRGDHQEVTVIVQSDAGEAVELTVRTGAGERLRPEQQVGVRPLPGRVRVVG